MFIVTVPSATAKSIYVILTTIANLTDHLDGSLFMNTFKCIVNYRSIQIEQLVIISVLIKN